LHSACVCITPRGAVAAMIIEPGTVLLDGRLRLSFQRYPEAAFSAQASPQSHGALPVALSKDGRPLVPVAPGEALWIGLRLANPDGPLTVRATCLSNAESTERPELLPKNEATARDSPLAIIWHVITHTGSPAPIVGASLQGNTGYTFIDVSFPAASAPQTRLTQRFHLCSYEEFSAATGAAPPDPIETATVYGGWLLP
jgi:hypothetical protein